MRVGLIADTHGLLRPDALEALAGADVILHAGDVGGPEILSALGRIAPVHAVRGNNDRGAWADALPAELRLELGGRRVLLVHDAADAVPGDAEIVVVGHSHRPRVERRDGVLWINPGSAGPRRFRLPVGVAILEGEEVELIALG